MYEQGLMCILRHKDGTIGTCRIVAPSFYTDLTNIIQCLLLKQQRPNWQIIQTKTYISLGVNTLIRHEWSKLLEKK